MYSRPFALDPSNTYLVSCWARTVSGTGTLFIRLIERNAAGTTVAFNLGLEAVTVPGGWTYYSVAVAPASTVTTGVISLDIDYPSSTATIQVQAFQIQQQVAASLIVNGTITATQIAAGAITTSKLSVLSTGGTTIDMSAGQITFNNGAYMKVLGTGFGSTSQFIEWYGPTQSSLSTCTETNAVYYLKTSGGAYFGGTLLAGKLTNTVQGTILDTTNVASLGPFSSNGGQITITWSYDFATHNAYPGTSTGLTNYNAVTKQNPSAVLIVSQSVGGGSFTDVLTVNITNGSNIALAPVPSSGDPGFYNQFMSGSGTYTDNLNTTSTRQYKLRFSSQTNVDSTTTKNTLSLQSVE
jgi:hypothetical protein